MLLQYFMDGLNMKDIDVAFVFAYARVLSLNINFVHSKHDTGLTHIHLQISSG